MAKNKKGRPDPNLPIKSVQALSKGEGTKPASGNYFYCFINCNTCFSLPLCSRSQYLPAAKFFTGMVMV